MSSPPRLKDVVQFADFELDLRNGELVRAGSIVKLQPQPAKVLVLLVSQAGEIVTRAEIAQEVWGSQTFVDFEQGLNFAIRQIRTALGDDAEQPRFLETLPKRGYRFIASVSGAQQTLNQGLTHDDKAAAIAMPAPDAIKTQGVVRRRFTWRVFAVVVGMAVLAALAGWRISQRRVNPAGVVVLAVLPFDDLSPDAEPYLVEGLTEEMIARLTRINPQRLKVIARTSAMQYARTKKSARQIGQELGADYILENSIRHEGGRLRITAQLVRAADQTHLWAETYEREMAQLLPLESEVTSAIAEQIHVQLLSAATGNQGANQRPVNPDAHELYLQGRHYFNLRSREGLQKSLEFYNQALAKDPAYAAAYAGMADSYNLQAFYGFDPSMNTVSQAKIAAQKALELDDSVAAAHAALGYTKFMWREDWQGAEQEFRRAIELDDNYIPAHQWFALYLAAQGRKDESLRQMEVAEKIDPLSPSVHAGSGYMHYLARDYEKAVEHAQVALQLNPNLMVAHAVLGWTYIEQKKYAEAIHELDQASQLSGGVPVYRSALGRAYALSGDLTTARKIRTELETAERDPLGSGTALAALCLAIGDTQRALRRLEMSAPGDVQANWLRVDPAFDSIRSDPRFVAVVARLGADRE